MQIVIDIPKKIYDHILRTNMLVNSDRLEVTEAIIDGTPLPKGHGRLVDYDEIKVEEDVYNQCYVVNAPTVLEAE